MSQGLTTPAHSLGRKASGLIKFWKKPRPTTPVPESELVLPTEIWLDILDYLLVHELEPLALVCKRLRRIILPLFFRQQLIFPFMDTFAFRLRNKSVELPGYQERSLQRIQFLCSEQIATAVRELTVSPYPPGYNRRHRGEHKPVEAVMYQVLSILPRFVNLTKLTLRFTPCDKTMLGSLLLLRVDFFELELPPTAKGDFVIPARKEFVFNHNTSILQMFSPEALTLSFLFPESLERISAGPTGTDAIAEAILRSPGSLPSLQSLDVALGFASSPYLAETLVACPNLTALRLRRSALDISLPPFDIPPLPTTALARLMTYHGPARLAPALTRGGGLRTARLWSSPSVSAADAPWDLLPILQQLGASSATREVTHLELGTVLVPSGLLSAIHAAFPALTTLAINAHFDVFHPGAVERRAVRAPSGDPAALRARLRLPAGFRPERVRLGVQLSGVGETELFAAARAAVEAFPERYDPTAWRLWVVDRPWHRVEWTRLPEDGYQDPTVVPSAGEEVSEPALWGTLSIEYGEHYFRSFERGGRIAALSVEEAVARLT